MNKEERIRIAESLIGIISEDISYDEIMRGRTDETINGECLICGAPLQYMEKGVEMECEICHKKEITRTKCENGHFVCSSCHESGIDAVISVCLKEKSLNPVEIMDRLMSMDFCHMHGPEHHIMVGSALLTAYHNAGGDIDVEKSLVEMQERGREVPGGACGFWGACGAGISAGIFVSIVTGSTPLAEKPWGLSNTMTSKALGSIGEIGGPRCCKRNSYLATTEAVKFAEENLGVKMEMTEIRCSHSHENNQCIGKRCPFNAYNR